MITLQTINTIELSNICNLQCSYCISRLMKASGVRRLGIMDSHTFDASLALLKKLVDRGTQKEVNLNGNGESTLDPHLNERVRRVKDIVGNRTVQFCSNALLLTEERIRKLFDHGLDILHISPHSPEHVRRIYPILKKLKVKSILNAGPMIGSHNWAGQLEKDRWVEPPQGLDCVPMENGFGYIQVEGMISPCCYDYRHLGTFTTVFSDDALSAPIKPYELCPDCHQKITPNISKRLLEDEDDRVLREAS